MRYDLRYLFNRVWVRQHYCEFCDDFSRDLWNESESWWHDWQEWKCQTCDNTSRITIERGNL